MNRSLYCLLSIIFLLTGLLFFTSADMNDLKPPLSVQAQTETEPDALAVRVLPNPDHADPLRWYKERGLGGDPARLTVDGYNAVRDGRTVYVNVGNVVNGNFYTNIYVLSYTQNATGNTVEIFNRLLKNFDFNTNLVNEESDLGYCSISTHNCVTNEDCPSDYKCSDNRKCVPQEPIRCYRDTECAQGIFCDSNKSEVIRDTERLAQMREIERLAEEYKKKNNEYPKLEAGTYLPGKTISVWPSWERSFQKELASVIAQSSVFDSLPKDPINRLSRCSEAETPQYNQETCWDETEKVFAGNVAGSSISLPTYTGSHPYKDTERTFSSHAYTYVYGSFNTCTPLETQDVNVEGFSTGPCSTETNISTHKETENDPPQINCGTMSAHPEDEFSKYIHASDPNNDPVGSWDMELIGDWSSWSSEPELRPTGIGGYREIYASQTGDEGRYEFNVRVVDTEGALSERTCEVVVGNAAPFVSFSPCDGSTKIGEEYNCNPKSYDPDGDDLNYNISGLPPCLNFDAGTISGTCNSSDAGEYTVNITASDGYGESNSDSLSLHIETYCGDGTMQTPNMQGGHEECDEAENNGEPCEPAYDSSCSYCNESCELVTKNAPTECGDGTVQEDQGEECDEAENDGEPCEPAYGSSCTYCNSLCKEQKIIGPYCGDGTTQGPEHCETPDDCPHGEHECNDCECEGGYCGDGTIQPEYEACEFGGGGTGPDDQWECDECKWAGGYCGDESIQSIYGEECESGGSGSGSGDQYECSGCNWTGGYCGDGNIQSSYEDCEIGISTSGKRTALQDQGVSNVSGKTDAEIENIYDGACSNCNFQCSNWSKAGLGCYIGSSCEKGSYQCNGATGNFECTPFSPPVYDHCCVNNNNPHNPETGESLHDLNYDVIYPSTSDPANSSFKCDEVCRNYGKVCIGVGLMDSNTNYCKSIKHHEPPFTTCSDGTEGKNCTNDINITGNDCRTTYEQNSNDCVNCYSGDGYWFTVGGTACYCN